MKKFCLIGMILLMTSGCVGISYQPVENLASLEVSFVDSKWDGVTVPSNHECKRDGGQGDSPALRVGNIPRGTNAIIVEFNDRSYEPLSYGGGHGAIWVAVSTENEITIPSVPSETSKLPPGVHSEHSHQADSSSISSGAYLAPCSRGRGNSYFADINAVYKAKDKSEKSKLLGQGKIELGKY